MRCESRQLIVRLEQKTKAWPFQSCPLAKARLGYVHHPANHMPNDPLLIRPNITSSSPSWWLPSHAANLLANPPSEAMLEIGCHVFPCVNSVSAILPDRWLGQLLDATLCQPILPDRWPGQLLECPALCAYVMSRPYKVQHESWAYWQLWTKILS